jgi:inosine-uridine nucleoside N-ribohydrolase
VGCGPCQDVDDVGTLCMLNALADAGEVSLLAIMVNTIPSVCTAAVSVLQHYYGRDDVPIGAYKGGGKYNVSAPYVSHLVDNWPSPIRSSAQVTDATTLYRRVLSAQEDGSTVIASVGLLFNLASLLRSPPDVHSRLSGRALVARKVRSLGIMGGKYPGPGRECNVHPAYTRPTPGHPAHDHGSHSAHTLWCASSIWHVPQRSLHGVCCTALCD